MRSGQHCRQRRFAKDSRACCVHQCAVLGTLFSSDESIILHQRMDQRRPGDPQWSCAPSEIHFVRDDN